MFKILFYKLEIFKASTTINSLARNSECMSSYQHHHHQYHHLHHHHHHHPSLLFSLTSGVWQAWQLQLIDLKPCSYTYVKPAQPV